MSGSNGVPPAHDAGSRGSPRADSLGSVRGMVVVTLLALLGIVLAAAITWGTSQLVRQRIGLASEPLSAGQRLLPRGLARAPTQTQRTTTVTVPATPPPALTSPTRPTTTPALTSTATPPPTSSAPTRTVPSPPGEGSDQADSAKRDD